MLFPSSKWQDEATFDARKKSRERLRRPAESGSLRFSNNLRGAVNGTGGIGAATGERQRQEEERGGKRQTFYAQIQADGTDGQFVPIKKERY